MHFGNHHMHDDELDDVSSRLWKLIPQQTQDMVAMFLFLVVLPMGILFEMFYILPESYPVFSDEWNTRAMLISFLVFNIYVNWAQVIRIGPNGPNPILPNVVQAGFRYCHSCHMNAPPRAYHCPVCDSCSFRRDHHCSFAATCVGHFNQRYFVSAAVNVFVMSSMFMCWTWSWLDSRLDGLSLVRAWQLMLPHLALLLRIISWSQFLNTVFFASMLTVWLFSCYLLAAQAFCIARGQTRVEYLMDVHAYQLGVVRNVRECLGARWPLALLSPLVPSPLPSNGLSWHTREMEEHAQTKSM